MNMQIFCDFDGTITTEDTIDKFLPQFSRSGWQEISQKWFSGEMGSKECLVEHFKLIPRPTSEKLAAFLDGVKIDPAFADFYRFTRQNNIDFYIVSDGLDFFIQTILAKHDLEIPFFSNSLTADFTVGFPNQNKDCERYAGTCKCGVIRALRKPNHKIIYIGDGISDICGAKQADIVFAKGTLLRHYPHAIEFSSFTQIKAQLKEWLKP